jgi:tetratricopeptide (TPR) repeat protein
VPVGERRPGPARTADLLPTLLGRIGIAPPAGLDGADLFGGPQGRESYAESLYARTFGWAGLRSFRAGGLKLIDAPRPELYDVASDPGETRDLAADRPDEVTRLRQALAAFRASERAAARAPADAESAERLRALGYVGEPVAADRNASDDGRADPKDRVRSYRAFEEAMWAEARGAHDDGVAGLRRVVADDPSNPVFRRVLAAALRRSGRTAEAATVLGALGDERDQASAWHERALALAAAGRLDDAEQSERKALALNPLLPEPHNHLGVLLARRGRVEEALARFEAAAALDPNNAEAWNNKGNALRALGRGSDAAAAYRSAGALDPDDPDPWNGLGVLSVQAGRADEAVPLFERALALEPRLHEARLNLAVALAQSGRRDDAVRELSRLVDEKGEIGAKARRLRSELLG